MRQTNIAKQISKTFIIIAAASTLAGCGGEQNPMDSEEASKTDSLQKIILHNQSVITGLRDSVAVLKDSVRILKYPADQRLAKAKEWVGAGELDKASKEIEQLKTIFPNSPEAKQSDELINKISEMKEAQRKEAERIKALGFKALPEQTTVKIDYNTVTLSNISVGQTFTFDSYDDRYFYRTADRGAKYVTMQMSVKSEDHNPMIPQLAVYSISGDKMILVGTFDTRFARWSDYGAYLGNYHDTNNDFAKVSTVRFKLGLQVDNDKLSNPYAIVLMKKNVLSYSYERFDNPPISYIGSAGYPSVISLGDFNKDYVIIKRYNLK